MRYFYFGIFILIAASLFFFSKEKVQGEKRVELVANFAADPAHLTAVLAKHGGNAKVVLSDLSQYKGLEKDKGWKKRLRQLTFNLYSPVKVNNDLSKIVLWNVTPRYRKHLDLSKLPKDKLVLFMWEPPSWIPEMYQEKFIKHFDKIYTWNDDLVDNKRFFKFYYPCMGQMVDGLPAFEDKKLLTLVATNFTKDIPNNLYIERKKAIEFFEKLDNSDFEFYGRGWEAREYKTYRGTIDNKVNVVKNYRFSICYENSCDLNGYVTEKIFDCFAAGNVPIYWGAPNIEKYVPKDCFIDRRDFKDLDDLYLFIKNMGKEEYDAYIARIQAYLQSNEAHLYSGENFEKIFSEAILN